MLVNFFSFFFAVENSSGWHFLGQGNNKAVENSCYEQSADIIQQKKHSSSVNKDALNQGPKLLQCCGGNGSNSPTNNETTVTENNQSIQPTGNLCHGHGNNNGGCEGDGNDPPKKNSNGLQKAHYREFAAEPVENKGIFLKKLAFYFNHSISITIKTRKCTTFHYGLQ